MATNDKTEPTYQEKLRQAADNLVALGKAPRGTFALKDNPQQLDNVELQTALKRYQYDAQKAGTLTPGASRDELFTNINAVAQAQVAAAKAAAGPPTVKKPDGTDVKKADIATNDKTEPTYQEKLRQVADSLATLGKAPRGTFALKENPKQLDNIELQTALGRYRFDAQKAGTLTPGASRDELFTNINAVAQAQIAATKAAGPQAGKSVEAKASTKNPDQAEVKKADSAAPKTPSADELKQQEAKAYLRVLGKTFDQFKAENALNNGADLAGKDATSPEALAALKARVKDSPDAAAFGRKMAAEYDQVQSGNKGALLANDDVRALQYALVANGQQLNKFGIDGKMGDETAAATRAQIARTPASPSTQAPTGNAAAPASPAKPAAASGASVAAAAGSATQPPAPVEDRSTYSPSALAEKQAQEAAQNGGQAPGQQVINNPQGKQIEYAQSPQHIQLGQRAVTQYYNQEARQGQSPAAREGFNYARPMSRQEQVMAAREAAAERRQDRIWDRQDYLQDRREARRENQQLANGIGQLSDRNHYNDGQGVTNVVAPLLNNIFRR